MAVVTVTSVAGSAAWVFFVLLSRQPAADHTAETAGWSAERECLSVLSYVGTLSLTTVAAVMLWL